MRSREAGAALMTVAMASLAIALIVAVLLAQALSQVNQAEHIRRDDTVIAGTEALMERYAAKMTINPIYYLQWVDEAERARRCTLASSPSFGKVVQPGNPWPSDCTEWTYEDPAAGTWFHHPLLDGDPSTAIDDMEAAVEVTPPTSSGPMSVLVVGRHTSGLNTRAASAQITAESLSEFFRVTEFNLSYGSGAEVFGKLYSGGNLSFASAPVQGKVHGNVYAEGQITKPPIFLDGAEGWDGGPGYPDIREVFPQPLSFTKFWTDLQILKDSACPGGICLQVPGATAYLIHPYVSGSEGRLKVWYSLFNPPSTGCLSAEEWWWLNADSASAAWVFHGDFDFPDNGALWADDHVIFGNRDEGPVAFTRESLSVYAGDAANPKNVILNADTQYHLANSLDTLGLIASDEIVLNPNAVGADLEFHINASLLGQADKWRVARSCGSSGSVLTPGGSRLFTKGTIATRSTGDIGSHFPTRLYDFDDRLQYLRPPLYPLVRDDWRYTGWREMTVPDWAG